MGAVAGGDARALAAHDRILRSVVEAHGGYVFSTAGDAFSAAFWTPGDAVAAAVEAQRRLGAEQWPEPAALRVRMGVHTGTAEEREGRLLRAGGEPGRPPDGGGARRSGAVVSLATEELVRDRLAEGVTFVDLGEHELAGLASRERVFQVCGPGLALRVPAAADRGGPGGELAGGGDELRGPRRGAASGWRPTCRCGG